MSPSPSAPARVFAVAALVCGVLVLVVVVAGSLGDGEGNDGERARPPAAQTEERGGGEPAPKAYVVQNGDTLTSIASKTGVPVDRIEDLNPGVDPQILVSGEKLKLR